MEERRMDGMILLSHVAIVVFIVLIYRMRLELDDLKAKFDILSSEIKDIQTVCIAKESHGTD
jgi:hypothetical protein